MEPGNHAETGMRPVCTCSGEGEELIIYNPLEGLLLVCWFGGILIIKHPEFIPSISSLRSRGEAGSCVSLQTILDISFFPLP